MPGEFGRYLNSKVNRDREKLSYFNYGKIQLDDMGRCSFLNEQNLCNIYINLGENYLCNVCKKYPRYIIQYGNRVEKVMDMSCPEVTRLILELEKPITFELEERERNDEEKKLIEKIPFNSDNDGDLWDMRMLLIEILQSRQLPMWKRMVFIK